MNTHLDLFMQNSVSATGKRQPVARSIWIIAVCIFILKIGLSYNCDAVKEMRKDFEHIFAESTEVTEKYKSGRSAVLRGTQCLLRLFAPLM